MAAAGTAAYLRSRDLPKLIALWPHELDDESQEGMFRVLAKLRRALRAERSRGLAGHSRRSLELRPESASRSIERL